MPVTDGILMSVRTTSNLTVFHLIQGVGRILAGGDLEAELLQERGYGFQDIRVVIDDEEAVVRFVHSTRPFMGSF